MPCPFRQNQEPSILCQLRSKARGGIEDMGAEERKKPDGVGTYGVLRHRVAWALYPRIKAAGFPASKHESGAANQSSPWPQ